MVAKKAKRKAPKLTYTDRVLTAFTQILRVHKKREVHLATIRAQVRRNAQARSESLGPQWSSLVGKAVHKLEEQGLLQLAGQPGNVSLTPSARKSITSARRSIPHTQSTENVLWRYVAQHPAGDVTPVKSHGHLGNSTAVLQTRPTARYTSLRTPRKRTPLSSASMVSSPLKLATGGAAIYRELHKPLHKMTKAELRTAYLDLQSRASGLVAPDRLSVDGTTAHTILDENGRALSPLTDIDDDQFEEEIPRSAEGFAPHYGPLLIPDVGSAPGHHLPPGSASPRLHSTVLQHSSVDPAHSRAGVIRTSSGSLISLISKQPTPAPSDQGAASMIYGPSDDSDVFGDLIPAMPPRDRSSSHHASSREQLESTQGEIGNQILQIKTLLTQHGLTLNQEMEATVNPAKQLNFAIQALMNAFRALSGQLELEEETSSALKQEIAKQTMVLAQVHSLEDCVARFSRILKDKEETLASSRTPRHASFDEAIESHATLRNASSQYLANNYDDMPRGVVAEKEAHAASTLSFTSQVADFGSRLAVFCDRLNDKEEALLEADSRINILNEEIQHADFKAKSQRIALVSEIDSLRTHNDTLSTLLQTANSETASLTERVSALEEQLLASQGSADVVLTHLNNLQEALDSRNESLVETCGKLNNARTRAESLDMKMAEKDLEIVQLHAMIDTLNCNAQSLLDDLNIERVSKASLEKDVASSHAGFERLDKIRSALESQLEAKVTSLRLQEQDIQDLRTARDSSRQEVAALHDALGLATQQCASSEHRLAETLSCLQVRESELNSMRGRVDDLEAKVHLLQEARRLDENTILELKALFSDFAHRQSREMDALTGKFGTAAPSAVDLLLSNILPQVG